MFYEGKHIVGTYYGASVSGVVRSSRVGLGGRIKHTIALDKGFSTLDGRISREAGEEVILETYYNGPSGVEFRKGPR